MDGCSCATNYVPPQIGTKCSTVDMLQSEVIIKSKEKISSAELQQLLGAGGDERLSADPSTGLNMYGCPLGPTNPSSSTYLSSSTATPISPGAFAHLTEVMNALKRTKDTNALDERMEVLRHELLAYFGLAAVDADIVFVPSGTDATLQSVFLAKLCLPRPTTVLTNLVLAVDEAAGRVIDAVSGCHFNTKNIRGEDVIKGAPIAGLHGPDEKKSIRCIDLSYEKCQDEAAIEQLVNELISGTEDTHVFLHAIDTSKLGNRTPSHGCLDRIERQHRQEALTVLIDACQFRISPGRLREHICRGRLVTVTGSKFLTGPPFSGAIIIPARFRARIQQAPVNNYMSSELAAYSAISDWPQSWTHLRQCLASHSAVVWHSNIGQFLRLTAAVFELRRYSAVPLQWREQFILAASAEIRAAFANASDLLQPVENTKRGAFFDDNDEEFRHVTIFPFLIRRSSNSFLDQDACKQLYSKLKLRTDDYPMICVIGQPATIVLSEYPQPITIFRFAIDARTVTDQFERSGGSKSVTTDLLRSQLRVIINKIYHLVRVPHSTGTDDKRA